MMKMNRPWNPVRRMKVTAKMFRTIAEVKSTPETISPRPQPSPKSTERVTAIISCWMKDIPLSSEYDSVNFFRHLFLASWTIISMNIIQLNM